MLNDFKEYYSKLPENLQNIMQRTIHMMSKNHKILPPKKRINVKEVVDYYRKKKEWSVNHLLALCAENCNEDEKEISSDTYYSIMKRNVVNIKNNKLLKKIIEVLDIPTDNSGNILFIEHDYLSPITKTTHKSPAFTHEYYEYLVEFQNNSVYYNFECLDEKNKRAMTYLAKSLYYNQTCSERFMINPDEIIYDVENNNETLSNDEQQNND